MANKVVRRIGAGVLIILLLVAAAIVTIYAISARHLSRRYSLPDETLAMPTDSSSLFRGEHFATAISKCSDCHGADFGGTMFLDAMPLGRFVAPNLTGGKGSRTAGWSDADWIRAVRHGVGPAGKPLIFMPSQALRDLNAADLGAIIAYVRKAPAVDNVLPPTEIGPIGRFAIATNPKRLISAEAIDHTLPFPAGIAPGPTAEYGRYLAVAGGCTFCHGENLAGGIKEGPPGTPPSANLTPAGEVGGWSEAQFMTALREGRRPDGTTINPFMPWRLTRLMTDEEIQAVYRYVKTLPAKQ
ncbi:MAG: c-type cytochrome [Gemmatimonadota bacterium]